MTLKQHILSLLCLLLFGSFAPDKPAYRIYNSKGKEVKYKKVIKDLMEADIVFFGEQHNNPIAHWLQIEVTADIFQQDTTMVMGAEMFETDNQLLLNEYLKGLISESRFEDEARLWENYKTDYKPLLHFAKNHNLHFVATNVPRRYASMVMYNGFQSLTDLSDKAKSYMAPLPIPFDSTLESYQAMLDMGHGGMQHGISMNFPKSQALKDATMAWFIGNNLKANGLFIHFNGSYHSDNFEGIVWYVNNYFPGKSIKVISTVEQDDISHLEEENIKGDYIIVVPTTMTKTY